MEISDEEYDQIQEEAEKPIWPDFRAWLAETEGVSPNTARTYTTQVRRILRETDSDRTAAVLSDWINTRPARHRTPFRSSWRKYRAYAKVRWGVDIADFVSGSAVPDAVIEALGQIKARNIGSGTIEKLTCRVNTGKERDALARINEEVENNTLLVCRCSDDSLALIPKAAWKVLFRWGKQKQRVDDVENPRWLIPAYPGASEAMKAVKITRLVRQHARKSRPS